VFDGAAKLLYEMWRANITFDVRGGCLAVWNAAASYAAPCAATSARAPTLPGFRLAPLAVHRDEVKAGHIDHAIRFILPTTGSSAASCGRRPTPPTPAVPATRRRTAGPLPAARDYPIASLAPGARVVAQAMQKYGMYHADGATSR